MTPLGALIAQRIAAEGPMPVAVFMALCLGHREHGYYATRDPLGAAGDFTTAPEVSQMFGELVGAWLAQVWLDQGAPAPFTLAELGPGRGTLMADALRVAGRVPGFRAAARVWLVETSPALRARQAAALAGWAPRWADAADALPELPLLLVANEFFDALPVRQFLRVGFGWRERVVQCIGGALAFGLGPVRPEAALERRFGAVPDGATVEVSPAGEAVARAVGRRVAANGGAALVVDYGAWEGTGDTLQAVRAHAFADPLAAPGEADLTAHVRFRALAGAAGPGLRVSGPARQGSFLRRLGIEVRAERLARRADAAARAAVAAQLRRLTGPAEMGNLFRVMALTPQASPPPPGFADDDHVDA
jgi:NADH dehydrogenase [ubiquinone] 1 alpha subcomplex assembly factor 7